jgi:DNA polymerase
MQVVTLDFESFWDVGHTLTRLSPIEYVMHPKTEIISLAIKINNDPTQVYFGSDIESALKQIDWNDSIALGHNMSGFDGMIMSYRYGIKPKLWACTQAMARPLHAKTCGTSLAKLSEHYRIGVKDSTALINTKGKTLDQFTPDEIEAMREYNKEDVELCYKLFKILAKITPPRELELVDMTVRMLTEPAFELNTELLQRTLEEEKERKQLLLLDIATMIGVYKIGMSDEEAAEEARKHLASASKFGEILKAFGVPVPMKPSPSNPDKQTPALAKTDQAFIELQTHSDPMVSAAAQARLGVKSTILESRIQQFLNCMVGDRLPVFLNYYGADTTGRWGGGGNLNQQNLPRVGKEHKPSDALRYSLKAPKGFKVVVADLSGIELRVNHFLWKVPSSMALFQADPEKADLYKEFAATLYHIDPSEVNKEQRQIGKIAHLGLGFGAGATTFKTVAKMMGGVELSEMDAKDVVTKWREAYSEISMGWKTCHASLEAIDSGYKESIDPWGLCHTVREGIITPQGMIRYPNLRQELGDDNRMEWVYGEGRHKARIYAGKIDENIVQHLAREVIADNMIAIRKATGYRPVLTVHDELIYIVADMDADAMLATVQSHMRTPPTWWPELITWSAGDIGDTYGDAK